MSTDVKELEKRMAGAMEALKKEFGGLRTGRASVNLLDPVMVEAYGQRMPLNQVGTVSAPEARLLAVNVWDKGLVTPTAKAIRDSGLGLNPQPDGQTIRIPLPELTSERRAELAKLGHKYAEGARIATSAATAWTRSRRRRRITRSPRTSIARNPTRSRS
jgi:ribosome recycling factor